MHSVTVHVGKADITLETGRMAKQANGAVFGTLDGSAVLATVCCSADPVEGLDYVPLQVEYNEKYYAAGKIPGGFIKREGRPKDKEILISRLIDRPMRPLFSKRFMRDIQVVPTTVSTDQENPPDIVAMNAASAAVHISDVPFDGPIGAVRVVLVESDYVVNPTFAQIADARLEIIVAGTKHGITMVEGGAKQVSEEELIGAIEAARDPISRLCAAQDELRTAVGKNKLPLIEPTPNPAWVSEVEAFLEPKIAEACFVAGKHNRSAAIKAAAKEAKEQFGDVIGSEGSRVFSALVEELEQRIVRRSIVDNKRRTDGRGPEDIRTIACDVGVLKRTHGSALFTRGETQALAVTTLGTVFDEQVFDDIYGDSRQRFMLHYNFPPFSVGETGRLGTGRREIGHGHLAHRALQSVLPDHESFPYTVRVVSEVLESNGSSSMATVCGGTLSLLNAGVPISKPVAGIAMGLVQEGDKTVVLSDILGEEDHLGDMDFKVAGTEDGITAFQMDIKISNVSADVMRTALDQAKRGRMHILNVMGQTLSEPAAALSSHAPRIITFKVDPDKIGLMIGPGGKTIRSISEKYDVETNIENDGTVTIYCKNGENAEQARDAFHRLLEEPEVGKVYDGVVRRITDFGAFIEFLPSKEGLCHISRMAAHRVERVEDVLELSQVVQVKIIEIDKMGRVNLSLLYEGGDEPRERGDRERNNRDRGGRDHGRDDRDRHKGSGGRRDSR